MPNDLTQMTPEAIIASLKIDQLAGTIECPICGKAHTTQQNATGSNFWQHFYSKRHAPYRPRNERLGELLISTIKSTARKSRRLARQAIIDAEAEKRAAEAAEKARQDAYYTVTGHFLDEITAEMESLISMMEPYYSQANAGASAEKMIARIEGIMRPRATAA